MIVASGVSVSGICTPGILQNVDPVLWRNHCFGLSQSSWKRLNGRSFWILGAGTGYGRCIALALAAAGAEVFISGRRLKKLQETLAEGKSLGIDVGRCTPIPLDITVEQDLIRAREIIRSCREDLYGVVHSAALPQSNGGPFPLADQSVESWNKLLATNVTGPWLTSKVALPLLEKGDGFRILFLSSEAGWATTSGFGPYNISKSAVNTLGASLAEEWALRYPDKDVQINVLVPGEARTEMNQGSIESPYSVVGMTLMILSSPPGGPNGYFFHRDGRHLPFAYSCEYPRRLMG